jgi:hypothetical protein
MIKGKTKVANYNIRFLNNAFSHRFIQVNEPSLFPTLKCPFLQFYLWIKKMGKLLYITEDQQKPFGAY